MIRHQFTTIGCLLLLALPAAAQQASCPPGYLTEPMVMERIDEIMRSSDERAIRTRISGFISSSVMGLGCDMLSPEVDRQALLETLIATILRSDDSNAHHGLFRALRVGFRDPERHQFRLPFQTLVTLVESEDDSLPRALALITLVALSDYEEVTDYLLPLARAPIGPRSWPDQPLFIVRSVMMERELGDAPLRTRFLAEPELIRHPEARCVVIDPHARHYDPCPEVVIPPHS